MNELFKDFKFRCQRCFDSGIWLTPTNDVVECSEKQLNPATHPPLNSAAPILERAARKFKERNYLMPQTFDLARILSNYTSIEPCSRQSVFELFWLDTNLTEADKNRKFAGMLEELSLKWLLPIVGTQTEPFGYWISTNHEDFKSLLDRLTEIEVAA